MAVTCDGAQIVEPDELERDGSGDIPVSVLGKAHRLLAAFTGGATTLGLTELSRRSGVPKASAHRLSMELASLGYLSRTPEGYQLGWRIYELGQLVPAASLRAIARPALVDLRMSTKAVIHLVVPRGRECVYLERLVGQREMASVAPVGMRMPSFLTASGRIFLAYNEDPHTLDSKTLTALGLKDHREARKFFADIRNRRYAEERQQCSAGVRALSVPIMYGDKVIGAVSATVPISRRDDQQLLHALWATAADISRGLQRSFQQRLSEHYRSTLVG
ncbi:IclR family transcriptional regulator [Streptomyces violaceusniger]|uniref:IclR family transcriptional regulator n=1 Tax=Streptomyces violaceusniger TaxID=68280 RepID=UPI00341765C9